VEPSIAFSPTSQHLVVTENHKFTVFAVGEATSSIDTVTMTLRSSAEASPLISCALFSPDGDMLAIPFASTVSGMCVGNAVSIEANAILIFLRKGGVLHWQ
jgi:hypothetical protein